MSIARRLIDDTDLHQLGKAGESVLVCN